MGRRRKQNGIELFAALPWPVGIAAGLVGFIGLRYGFTWWMGRQGGLLAQGFHQGVGTMLSPLAWMVPAICWIGAVVSFVGSRHRRKLLDTRTDLESLSQGGWRQFELLVGEAFRRQGYAVEETDMSSSRRISKIRLLFSSPNLKTEGAIKLLTCRRLKYSLGKPFQPLFESTKVSN